jgi:hypothetical protein
MIAKDSAGSEPGIRAFSADFADGCGSYHIQSAFIRACQPEPWRRLVISGKFIPLFPLRPPVKSNSGLAVVSSRKDICGQVRAVSPEFEQRSASEIIFSVASVTSCKIRGVLIELLSAPLAPFSSARLRNGHGQVDRATKVIFKETGQNTSSRERAARNA